MEEFDMPYDLLSAAYPAGSSTNRKCFNGTILSAAYPAGSCYFSHKTCMISTHYALISFDTILSKNKIKGLILNDFTEGRKKILCVATCEACEIVVC